MNCVGFFSEKSYNRKLVVSGKVVEYYEYQYHVIKDKMNIKSGRNFALYTSQDMKKENRKKTASRAKKRVCRVANANPQLNKFLTLTFAENMQDYKKGRYEFDKFIKRLKTQFENVQYIAVPEFQERGAIHFHLLCNLPYVDVNALADIWGNGFIKINKIDNIDDVGAYITKYMSKDCIDERLIGKKCYTMSKGLNEPKVYTNNKAIDEIIENLDSVKRIFSSEYESEYYGIVKYSKIVCENIPKIKSRKPFLIPITMKIASPFDLSLNGV